MRVSVFFKASGMVQSFLAVVRRMESQTKYIGFRAFLGLGLKV